MKKYLTFVFLLVSTHVCCYTVADYTKDINEMSAEEKQQFFTSADDLKCPTCTGLSVLGSDAAFSMQIRKKVVELVKEKKDDKAIKEYFVERYGLWILRAPPKSGFHLVIWLIPASLLLLVLIGFFWFILKNKKNKNQHESFDEQERIFLTVLEAYKSSQTKEA